MSMQRRETDCGRTESYCSVTHFFARVWRDFLDKTEADEWVMYPMRAISCPEDYRCTLSVLSLWSRFERQL